MSTGSGAAVGGKVAGVTSPVTALGAGCALDLSHFAFIGLVELAGSVLLQENSSGLGLCVCVQGLAAEVVPFLLGTRVVDVGVQRASEVTDLLTQARDVSVCTSQ